MTILTISNPGTKIYVRGSYLVISSGDSFFRFRRSDCAVKRLIVTRPDGFITFPAIKWLHDIGVSFLQLDWDGTALIATSPRVKDLPAIRRAQAFASENDLGLAITREMLRAKLKAQALFAEWIRASRVAHQISAHIAKIDQLPTIPRLLAIEAASAKSYWSLWRNVPLWFVDPRSVPEHWHSFGPRHSNRNREDGSARHAATPGNAMLNYLYAVAAGEMSITLANVGLDPGIGVFHADKENRPSLAYDALEVMRPYIDRWFFEWLTQREFSKRDFYEERDGTIRITLPLRNELPQTAKVWRPMCEGISRWLLQVYRTRLEPRALSLARCPLKPSIAGVSIMEATKTSRNKGSMGPALRQQL
jgi:CRISPR-associated protein Cas1